MFPRQQSPLDSGGGGGGEGMGDVVVMVTEVRGGRRWWWHGRVKGAWQVGRCPVIGWLVGWLSVRWAENWGKVYKYCVRSVEVFNNVWGAFQLANVSPRFLHSRLFLMSWLLATRGWRNLIHQTGCPCSLQRLFQKTNHDAHHPFCKIWSQLSICRNNRKRFKRKRADAS